MVKKKLCPGIGAQCSVLIKFLHPSKRVTDVLINFSDKDRLYDLLAIKAEQKRVKKKIQDCIIFRHDAFPNEELYCVRKFCKVLKEGHVVDIFSTESEQNEEESTGVPVIGEVSETLASTGTGRPLPDGHENFRATPEDISLMRDMGFNVDDNNDPAPENIPNQIQQESGSAGSHQGLVSLGDGMVSVTGENIISVRVNLN